jgi:small subunit ribosomal protein S16
LVKIRLKRMGAKKRPFYRLVVADSRSPRDGRFIELLGYYDPLTNPAKVQVDADKVRDWMRKGARPSDAARALLVEQGILAKVPRVFKPAPETAAAPTAAVETPTAEPAAADAEPVAQAEPTAEAETAADAETEPAAQADAAEADVTP